MFDKICLGAVAASYASVLVGLAWIMALNEAPAPAYFIAFGLIGMFTAFSVATL